MSFILIPCAYVFVKKALSLMGPKGKMMIFLHIMKIFVI